MRRKELFSIGEASDMCNVSKKALRFYDEIGLIAPDKVGENGYRFYSLKTLLTVPVIKYFHQMGFTLEKMKCHIHGATYKQLIQTFKNRINEISEEKKLAEIQQTSCNDWYDLIVEAACVIDDNATEVNVKFFQGTDYLFYDQDYIKDYAEAIINIPFTNFIEEINNAITGPVIRYFENYAGKEKANKMKMLQKAVFPLKEKNRYHFQQGLYLSCYHIGNLNCISETYKKMIKWAKKNNYALQKDSYERYVTDYWTTAKVKKHVAEIIIPVTKKL